MINPKGKPPQPSAPTGRDTLAGIPIHNSASVSKRLSVLLWGMGGCGKTTYAATAPGQKLILSLEPDGQNAIAHRKDCKWLELGGLSRSDLFNQLQSDNPLGLDKYLLDHPEIGTLVLDSATQLSYRALQESVSKGYGRSAGFTPTMEMPGLAAYGGRNGITLECVQGLLKVTAKHNRHVVIITHEDDAKLAKDGSPIKITMVLGGKLVNNLAWRLTEIWHMSEVGRSRYIATKPYALLTPMRSRMFNRNGSGRFTLNYNAEKPDSVQKDTLAAFYDAWIKGGAEKMPIPGGGVKED